MPRKSRKAELLKQEIINSVPAEQRKMIMQPITFTYLNGEMTMTQTRIQTMIMERLQERIAKALKKKSESGFVGDLFTDEDFKPSAPGKTPFLTFEVRYSELGVDHAHYSDVDKAAKAMMRIVYEKDIIDDNGQPAKEYAVVFDRVIIPEKDKNSDSKVRRDAIKLKMLPEVASDLFHIIPYHQYLKDAIFLFSGSYTGRIYLLINANKSLGTWTIEYERLRKILLTSYDRDNRTVTVDKYRDISDFKKRVLESARKEIDAAADRVDCTFDYEFRYPAGKKRGTPEAVVFHIHLTDLGRNIKKAQLESQEASELRKLLVSLSLNITEANRLMKDAMKQIPANQYTLLTEKARRLKQYYAEEKAGQHPKIENYRNYTLKTLRDFITEQSFTPAEEIKEPAAVPAASPSGAAASPAPTVPSAAVSQQPSSPSTPPAGMDMFNH